MLARALSPCSQWASERAKICARLQLQRLRYLTAARIKKRWLVISAIGTKWAIVSQSVVEVAACLVNQNLYRNSILLSAIKIFKEKCVFIKDIYNCRARGYIKRLHHIAKSFIDTLTSINNFPIKGKCVLMNIIVVVINIVNNNYATCYPLSQIC